MKTKPKYRKVIYIAGPFRAPHAWGIEQNVRVAEELALQVWLIGAACICPHSNTRFFQGAAPDHIWLEGDLAILLKCDFVLMTPNWEKSAGARKERDSAIEHGIPVFYSLVSLVHWLELNEDTQKAIKGSG